MTPLARSILALLALTAPAIGDAIAPRSYGPNDTIGAANNLSPSIVRDAARLIRTGRVYSLAITTGDPKFNGRPFPGRDYSVLVEQQHPPGATIHDDRVTIWNGVFGTSMDGLGHVGRGDHFYNDTPAAAIYGRDGLRKMAIDGIPPIVSRGVLLDFPAYYGVGRLPPHKRIDRAEIQAVARRERIELRRGDVVLIHTGWQPLLLEHPERFAEQPGLGIDGARYLGDLGIVAVGSDNHGIEAMPQQDAKGMPLPVHPILLVDYGVYLLEDIRTEELARDRVWQFLFVLGQPRLKGAAQAPINPIAIH